MLSGYFVFLSLSVDHIVWSLSYIFLILLLGSFIVDPVLEATEECGYSLTKEQGNNVIHIGFSGCHVTVEVGINVHFVFCGADSSLFPLSLLPGWQIYSVAAVP